MCSSHVMHALWSPCTSKQFRKYYILFQVLTSFLQTSRIFCTQLFNSEYEAIARLNIRKEIDLLNNYKIPGM